MSGLVPVDDETCRFFMLAARIWDKSVDNAKVVDSGVARGLPAWDNR